MTTERKVDASWLADLRSKALARKRLNDERRAMGKVSRALYLEPEEWLELLDEIEGLRADKDWLLGLITGYVNATKADLATEAGKNWLLMQEVAADHTRRPADDVRGAEGG